MKKYISILCASGLFFVFLIALILLSIDNGETFSIRLPPIVSVGSVSPHVNMCKGDTTIIVPEFQKEWFVREGEAVIGPCPIGNYTLCEIMWCPSGTVLLKDGSLCIDSLLSGYDVC
jgi:hypothetical protein